MTGTLQQKVAVVTGGGRGIGREHCLELARQGAIVIVVDTGASVDGCDADRSPADDVVHQIESAGGVAVAEHVSVTDWDGVRELVHRAVDRFGRLDVVVNNAGILRDRMITSMEPDDFHAVVAVHLEGTFTVTKHACDYWRSVAKAGGVNRAAVVNTCSGVGMRGNVGQAAYGSAKAGIAILTITTALEMARYGVTVNAIAPVARTRMTEGMLPEVPDDQFDPAHPGNSSPVVAYLASDAGSWLTGQVLRVEGNTVRRYLPSWGLADGEVQQDPNKALDAASLHDDLRRLYAAMPGTIDNRQVTSGLGG